MALDSINSLVVTYASLYGLDLDVVGEHASSNPADSRAAEGGAPSGSGDPPINHEAGISNETAISAGSDNSVVGNDDSAGDGNAHIPPANSEGAVWGLNSLAAHASGTPVDGGTENGASLSHSELDTSFDDRADSAASSPSDGLAEATGTENGATVNTGFLGNHALNLADPVAAGSQNQSSTSTSPGKEVATQHSGSSAISPITYSYTTIDPPGSIYTTVNDINASGEVAGDFQDTSFFLYGFLYSGGSYTSIGSLGTHLTAVNDSGEVVGNSGSGAFLYDGSSYTTILVPGSLGAHANDINASGEVVGDFQYPSSGYEYGFLYSGGSYTVIGPQNDSTHITAINDSGQVVGNSLYSGAFLYYNGTYQTISVPGSSVQTQVLAINNLGQVAGNYVNFIGVIHSTGFVYDGVSYTTIEMPGSSATFVIDINDMGQVAGNYTDSNSNSHGFVYTAGTYITIDHPGGYTVVDSINNAGEVAGYYEDSDGRHGFTATPPCYCRSALILTDGGEIPVQDLAIGDRVITPSGRPRTVKWIGRRSYSGRFALGNTDILPICIKAGALDDGVPRRDLWISPHHAMYLEGVLIEARHLVNGVSIFQAETVDQVEYFHIELDRHDIIIAEGAPSESYIDDSNRGMFHNAHEYRALYPDEVRGLPSYCAKRLEEGLEVFRARQTIARRAGLPYATEERKVGALRGAVDRVRPELVGGWAQDVDNPEVPVCLDIIAGGQQIGQVLANRYRDDLADGGFGSGRHGFEFVLPSGLGVSPGSISVRRSLDGVALPLWTPPERSGTLRGCLEQASRTQIRGWAHDDAQPGAPLTLLILDNDVLVARVLANRYRTDLAAASIGDGMHGFQLDFAEPLSGDHRIIRVCREADGVELERSPVVLEPISGPGALVIDDRWPQPGRDAGSTAILSHIRSLQRLGYRVTFAAALEFSNVTANRSPLESIGVACCSSPDYASVEEILQRKADEFDVVYLHRISNAAKYGELVRYYLPNARLIYSVADLHHLRLGRQASIEDHPGLLGIAYRLRLQEFTAASLADRVITHSSEEAKILQAQVGTAKVDVVRWTAPVAATTVPFSRRRGMAFIGGFDHAPNVDAARWLIAEIMPLIRQSDPDIECLLVGSGLSEALRRSCGEGIRCVGPVEDLGAIFDRVRLTVAPLTYGAGIKGKVVDSFAAGVPCVCTPIAAEGMDLPAILKDCIADDAKAIAEAILRLHHNQKANDECRRAGLQYIGMMFSEQKLDGAIREIIGRSAISPLGRAAA